METWRAVKFTAVTTFLVTLIGIGGYMAIFEKRPTNKYEIYIADNLMIKLDKSTGRTWKMYLGQWVAIEDNQWKPPTGDAHIGFDPAAPINKYR